MYEIFCRRVTPEYSGHMHLSLVRLLFMPSPALSIVHAANVKNAKINEKFLRKEMCDTRQMQTRFMGMNNDGNALADHAYSHLARNSHAQIADLAHHARCRVICICINLRCNLSFMCNLLILSACLSHVSCHVREKRNSPLSKVSHC